MSEQSIEQRAAEAADQALSELSWGWTDEGGEELTPEQEQHYTALQKIIADALTAQRATDAALERQLDQTVSERDDQQEAMSQAYYLVMGRSPEWSNLFGLPQALEEIDDAQSVLRQTVAALTEQVRMLRKVLDEIAIALNDWHRERKDAHEARAKELRYREKRSVIQDAEPWVFAEETIRREYAERVEPICALMRTADAALAAAAMATTPVKKSLTNQDALSEAEIGK